MSESQPNRAQSSYDDEIDLREIFRVVWLRKRLVIACTVAGTVLSVIVVLLLPNIYRAEALLAPNDRDSAGSLSTLAAQFGGIASLSGINLGGSGTDQVSLGLEVLRSRKFIYEFIQRRDLLVPLMAAKKWNSENGELEIDSDDYDVSRGEWVRRVRPPREIIPSLQEAHTKFMNILSVSQDTKTGFVRLSLKHYSPIVAKEWVDWLIRDLNLSIMRQDVAEAQQAIEYLNAQIASTSVSELQNVFFSLIKEQTKIVMLARVSEEYLLKTIDPAVVPEKRSGPMRSLIVIIFTLIASFVSILYVLVSSSDKKS